MHWHIPFFTYHWKKFREMLLNRETIVYKTMQILAYTDDIDIVARSQRAM